MLWNIYDRGAAYLNHTKRLQINNNIYDSYTHEYLGNYLRFLRDYDGLDLMSLYNCFSNRLCSSIAGLNFDINTLNGGSNANNPKTTFGKFNSADSDYRIYLIPVKLFKNYTIAIDSNVPVEICCGIFKNATNLDDSITEYRELINQTYCKYSNTSFNKPFLYTALTDIAPNELSNYPTRAEILKHSNARKFIASIADRESNLMLILKIHKDVKSSITILEGDYRGWNDFSAKFIKNTGESTNADKAAIGKKIDLKHNHTVIANEALYEEVGIQLISALQLLQLNTKKHIPFADRLIEYLLDMCITGGKDEPRENVLMVQKLLSIRHNGSNAVLQYYKERSPIDSKSDATNQELPVIYTDRKFCLNPGDYYLTKDGTVYKYKSGTDGIDEKATDKTDVTKASINFDRLYSTEPLAFSQDIHSGIWNPYLQKLLYQFMTNNTDHNFTVHRDLLGYVDKDVEKYFVAYQKDKKTGKLVKKNMFNFNTWEDLE